ncbi:hypothetical protein GLOTRDRAFT_137935 [Gloeophyllum trabeum ATCC 11539]|uniref:Zn(2)-C6 fungal-type domain-containing protein n=1 Tax=Gloeophyllum trabeum (strain ATCC 11539 / FP-39264 / Madison 617) TaxID=670483 RepID=S7RNL7_GLOTA|nr:uncharacterized protein GLOTRDRAFT_137935 [Gloeophyllum trabeum ATCC 11539]EPQ56085.1 hypothetical protein GLOTRDRAFT_137935 [Gloeophyllum trabeum ATCC 11539]
MPPEVSKGSTRRAHRKDALDGHQVREIELRRSRGEISCAECRRLKIKCDKTVPCKSCRRRGCESLCPNDSLTTGQGTRSVLAATEHLYDQIGALTKRVRQLEDALATVQAQLSPEPHPLLRGDTTDASRSTSESLPASIEDDAETPLPDQSGYDYFGTLTVSENGVSRFFGPTGGLETLLRGDESPVPTGSSADTSEFELELDTPSLPTAITDFARSFPFHLGGPLSSVQKLVEAQLPPYDRALALCTAFSERATWVYRCLSKSQLLDDLLPSIYALAPPSADDNDGDTGPHALALLFTVLAIGALMESPLGRAPAERFFQVARCAICLRSALDNPGIATVQALDLMSAYNSMRGDDVVDRASRMETTWSLVTLAAHLSHTLGLHRESARWGLPQKIVERRRRAFWDIFTFDAWQSLATGRPTACTISTVDCLLPESDDPAITAGEKWMFQFSACCVAAVAAQAAIPAAPPYTRILELEGKITGFPAPPAYEPAPHAPAADLKRAMLAFVLAHSRETILLYLHRSYFIQAIMDHPANPLRSEYAPSFLTAYKSASTILKVTREHFAKNPDVTAPVWYVWSFAFSAAILFGAVVTKGPRSALAPSAMEELEQAFVLFTKAAPLNRRAAEALPIIIRLKKKARDALSAADSRLNGAPGNHAPADSPEEDELSIFAGKAKLVSRRRSGSLAGEKTDRASKSATPAPVASSSTSTSPAAGFAPQPQQREETAPAGPDWSYNYYDAYDGHYVPPPQPPGFAQDALRQHPQASGYAWPAPNAYPQFGQEHMNVDTMHFQQPQVYQQHPSYQASMDVYTQPFGHPPDFPPGMEHIVGTSGDTRMDQRWTSFVRDSGLGDDASFI